MNSGFFEAEWYLSECRDVPERNRFSAVYLWHND